MNILILTAKFGMGHYSVAESIKQKIEKDNVNIKIIDFYETLFPKYNKLFYVLFNFLVSKFSKIYNYFYCFSANSNVAFLNKKISNKISNMINSFEPNIIISTFPTCSKYISAYKKKKDSNIKLYTYITDVNSNREWITNVTNKYFVADKKTKEQLKELGVNQEKISIVGIPVKKEFTNSNIKRLNNELLIMGGGLGLINNMDKVIKTLSQEKDIHITIIAGKNKKVYNKYYNKYENISVINYTDEVYKYMKKATLIVSKSGGVTLFEAINSLTPIYTIKPFLQQEIGNAKYIEEKQIGKVIWDKKHDIVTDILNLLQNNEKLQEMSNNMKNIINEFENVNILEIGE